MIEQQIKYEKYIKELMMSDNSLIYKNNLELLRQFYNFILIRFKDFTTASVYLELFQTTKDITSSKIEENFSNLILEIIEENTEWGYFNTDELYKYNNKYGVYYIFNNLNNLIYVGRSSNVGSRSLQSFINKMPYGATYLKIIETETEAASKTIEAISIDYFMPLYNNQFESFNLQHRTYSALIRHIEVLLKKNKDLYPTSKKLDI